MTTQPNPTLRLANPPRRAADDSPSTASHSRPEGIRETIESIVIAFILAFVFRAFVVEAFVIPTGSMAPGLYGQHENRRCENCLYPFAAGILDPAAPVGRARCPNCGWLNDTYGVLRTGREAPSPPDSGDRILVLKWPYDIGGETLGPKRWDVVVFKDPKDGDTNYIKRLLGLPGEVLELIDGDVYSAPLEDVRQDILDRLVKPPAAGNPQGRRLTDEQEQALARVLKIRRKTKVAQNALWMLHYDHDYPPALSQTRQVPDFVPPNWVPQGDPALSAWDASSSRVRFDPTDDQQCWLDLKGKPIQDTYGYNKDLGAQSPTAPRNVGDVRLRFVLFPLGSEGELTLLLEKGHDQFRAYLNADGTVRIDKSGEKDVRIPLKMGKIEPLSLDHPLTIEFENVDYRVTLYVDGTQVLATDDQDYQPNVAKLLQASRNSGSEHGHARVAIAASRLPLEIRHLAVDRDVYYRSEHLPDERSKRTGQHNPYAGYPGWGTEHNPILLRANPRDHFCCGDNSPQSQDSRMWWEACPLLEARQGEDEYQLGTVPGDQLIGRAFFVYWPSGIRLSSATPAIIPSMGRMRIIR